LSIIRKPIMLCMDTISKHNVRDHPTFKTVTL